MVTDKEKIIWEYENNPEEVTVWVPDLGHVGISTYLLIEPYAYVRGQQNAERRKLAIEQGVFKPYAEDEEEYTGGDEEEGTLHFKCDCGFFGTDFYSFLPQSPNSENKAKQELIDRIDKDHKEKHSDCEFEVEIG